MLETLTEYHKAGIPLLRIRKGTKLPIDKEWNKLGSEDFNDTIDRFRDDDYNVGGVIGNLIGKQSLHTLVLDFDDPEYFEKLTEDMEFQELVLKSPVVRTPSGGRHVWVSVSSDKPINKWTFEYQGKSAGEVLGHKSMAVLPPSEVEDKKSGNGLVKYEKIDGDWQKIPIVSLKQIQKWFPKKKRPQFKPSDIFLQDTRKDPVSGWPVVKCSKPSEPEVPEAGPIAHAVTTILNAPKGSINNTINDMAFFLGLEAEVDTDAARKALQEAVVSKVGFPEEKAFKTIENGLTAGREGAPLGGESVPVPEIAVLEKARKQILEEYSDNSSELDMEYLPVVIQEYVNKATEGTMLSPTMVLMSLMTTLSTYIGHKSHFMLFEPMRANIWSLIFAGSGAGKSTALARGCDLFSVHDSPVKEEIKERSQQLTSLKANQKANLLDDIKSIEAGLLKYSSRITYDAFYELLSRKQNGGAFIVDEFSTFLHNFDNANNKGFKSELTSMYNAYYRDSKSTVSKGYLPVENPYISLIGVSTEEFVGDLLTPKDVLTGFLARFLLFKLPQEDIIPPALPRSERLFNSTYEYAKMKMVIDKIMEIEGDTQMKLSEHAAVDYKDAHDLFYENKFQESDPNIKRLMDAFCKRWPANIVKLAMILQWVEEPGESEIGHESVQGAISIVSHSANSTMNLYRGSLGGSRDERSRASILKFVADEGGTTSWGKVQRLRVLKEIYGGDPGAKEYEAVFQSLEESNRINITKQGRKAEWVISLAEVL